MPERKKFGYDKSQGGCKRHAQSVTESIGSPVKIIHQNLCINILMRYELIIILYASIFFRIFQIICRVLLNRQYPGYEVLTGTYVGNGANGRPITGLGFHPDLVIVKAGGTSTTEAIARTSTVPAGDSSKRMGTGGFITGGQPLIRRVLCLTGPRHVSAPQRLRGLTG
jgi:hypothetical protein